MGWTVCFRATSIACAVTTMAVADGGPKFRVPTLYCDANGTEDRNCVVVKHQVRNKKGRQVPVKPKGSRKSKQLGHLGKSKLFLGLHFDLLESLAYRSLSHSAVPVFIEMCRTYLAASKFDTVNIGDVGFRFTYGQCRHQISYGTFYKAVGEICDHGFFEVAPDLQSLKPASPVVYRPSMAWMRYEQSPAGKEAAAQLKARSERKTTGLEKRRIRRTKFYVEHPRLEESECCIKK